MLISEPVESFPSHVCERLMKSHLRMKVTRHRITRKEREIRKLGVYPLFIIKKFNLINLLFT